ncbi:alpha/beta hydrolase fold domain-containing protein [Microbacterium excoecariae]|uniref:alpha/beta hydrolase fold domain-containing protein n=1 Tax=Microbacterium excoecariae TaxID=2715210 RepID=UPI00140923DF|nr:alpha/beta hydrolase fold domain-containing protein [Microbacterium excoecariae]NHI15718.1 alpha/beta hydrolase fold domain-containing protein [Microbacterium excoecariae]
MDPRDTTIEGPHGPLGVRVYPADRPSGSALVWAHGGGFAAGSVDMPEGDAVARAFAARGVPTVSVDYRLAPVVAGSRWGDEDRAGVHYPVASEEVGAAFAWARAHAAEWGADPGSVALGGASAGANLAAGAALRLVRAGAALPAHLVLAYPTLHAIQPAVPADLTDALAAAGLTEQFSPAVVRAMYENYLGGSAESADEIAAPGTAGGLAGFPATTIVASDVDELRVSAAAFAAALEAAGADVAYCVEPGTRHGHLNRPDEPGFTPTIDTFVRRLTTS